MHRLSPEMSWYYSLKGKQKGPVSARDLLVLESAGVITRNSMVWAEGMQGWSGLDSVRDQIQSEAGDVDLAEFAVCAHSQQVLPRSEMIAYGDRFISPEHKDTFVQSLHEGTTLSDQLLEGEMRYVGFWWRVLASVIDAMVKGAINMMFMIPLGILAVPAVEKLASSGGNPDPEVMAGFIAGVFGAYFFMFLVTIVSGLVYETWMVGKYGGTVGKLALRFRVVNVDGSKLSYAKAFGRWAAEVLSKFIAFSILYGLQIAFILIFGVAAGGFDPAGGSDMSPLLGAGFLLVFVLGGSIACFPWWMAASTKEKKALHDVICSTRVIFK